MTETLQRKFVKPSSISDSIKCIVCSEVYTQPTRLYCSHTFCRQCINQCLKSKDICPICRTKIDKKNMGMDLIAHNVVNQLEVFCPVQDCPWRGMNSQLQFHYENQCQWRDKVKQEKTGKSYRKTKNFKFQMPKDEQVQQRINQNLTKGCLQARIQVAHRKNNPFQNNESIAICNAFERDGIKQKSRQVKKSKTYDFLQDLFG